MSRYDGFSLKFQKKRLDMADPVNKCMHPKSKFDLYFIIPIPKKFNSS